MLFSKMFSQQYFIDVRHSLSLCLSVSLCPYQIPSPPPKKKKKGKNEKFDKDSKIQVLRLSLKCKRFISFESVGNITAIYSFDSVILYV